MDNVYVGQLLFMVGGALLGGSGVLLVKYVPLHRKQMTLIKRMIQLKEAHSALVNDYEKTTKKYIELKNHTGEVESLLTKNEKIKVTLDATKSENLILRMQLKKARQELLGSEYLSLKKSECDKSQMKEMLKFARDLSHPDRGGSHERFIRYNEFYRSYIKSEENE